jgi:hypothetical protein
MGFLGDLGVNAGAGFNWAGLGRGALIVLVFVLVAIVAGAIAFFYYSKKAKKVMFKQKIPIFQEINGKRKRIGIDSARELFIPDTNISLYFLKGRKIYIARPTRSMGENEYWYSIAPNGEWVNFDLSVDPEHDTLAIADYDHRDTRYAFVNLKEIIKRNYSDKTVKWWKEYAPIITFIIIGFIFIGGCVFVLSRVGGLIKDLGPILQEFTKISGSMERSVQLAQNINSGVVPAG